MLRPAESVNRKHSPPAPVRLIGLDENRRVSPEELDRELPCDGRRLEFPKPAGRGGVAWRAGDGDPLQSVTPREYFERLTGLRVGRSGKVCCPFHELSVGRAVAGGVSPACSFVDASLTDRGGPE
jgi:hypothetical protein